jgi:hypothetical protein
MFDRRLLDEYAGGSCRLMRMHRPAVKPLLTDEMGSAQGGRGRF